VDPSDSVPASILKNYKPKQLADVFFVHPTTYLDPVMPNGWSASLKDIALNINTDIHYYLKSSKYF